MTPRRLVDARRVAADRGREDLPDGVRDEVRAREPGEALVDAARTQQQLPAPDHRDDRDEDQEGRQRDPRRARVPNDVERLADVDLQQDVADGDTRDDEGRDQADAAAHPVKRSCTRCSAAIASPTSASEWAGENGSDRTSAPARSVTGSGGWRGARRSRYAVSRCTGRKWIDVPMFSSASACW